MMGEKPRTDDMAAQRARAYWVAGSFSAVQTLSAVVSASSSAVPAFVSGEVVGLAGISGVEP
jgi:hypothetical protein